MIFLKNMSRVLGMYAFSLTVNSSIHLSILRTFCLKPCPHSNYIILKSYTPINNILETLSPTLASYPT